MFNGMMKVLLVAMCFSGMVGGAVAAGKKAKPVAAATVAETNAMPEDEEKAKLFVQLGHTTGVLSLAYSPDGRTVAAGGWDNNIKLWVVASGRELRTLRGHSDWVNSVTFSPDGRTLVSGSNDKTLKLWDVASGRELRTLRGHSNWVNSLAFSPDGRTLVSGSDDTTLKLWDAATGKGLRTLRGLSGEVKSVAFSPDGRTLVSGGRDSTIKLWDVASGQRLRTLSGHSGNVTSVAFSPDGRAIVSGSWDHTVKLWDVATGHGLRSLSGHGGFVYSVAFSPDGRTLVSGSDDKTIKLWDVASGEMRALGSHSEKVYAVAFSPDGRTLVSGSEDKQLKLWDVASGQQLSPLIGHISEVNSVSISPDGKTIASASSDKTLKLWDVGSGRVLRTLTGDSDRLISFAFSPDGRTLVSCDRDTSDIKISDVASGQELRTLRGHSLWVNSVAFSPDGRTIVSGGSDHTVKLWNVATGRELRTLSGHTEEVHSVAFSPDGRTIVSGGSDHTIKLWDVASGRGLRPLIGHSDWVNSVAFTPNGQEVISGSRDGSIRKWVVATGKEIIQYVSFDNGEWIAVTPEGYYNASEKGGDWLNVRLGNTVQGINQFYDVFYRPDIVEAKLRGEDISSLITLTIDDVMKLPPPEIAFTSVPSTSTANLEKVCYKAVATGGGIGEVRLFQNGKLIKSDGFYRESVAKADTSIKLASVDGATVTRALKLTKTTQKSEPPMVSNSKGNEYTECQEFETIPGDNEISVAAFNANNTIQSRLETVNFKSSRKPEEPHLYVLGIGIDKYAASENNLTYAVKDATDFRNMIQDKAKGLFDTANIHIEGLSDAAATKAGIQQAIAAISAKVKPWDSFILFVASHGYLQDNQYYIVTSDFDGAIDTTKMISSNEIVGMSKNIKSLSQLLIFDTCHAGGVDNIVGGLYDARMSVMAKKMGLHIYASAGGTQTALDGYKGNGLFTHALLKSMSAGTTTDSNHDKEVSVAELGESAKQETITISKQLGFPQSPNIINFGKDNAVFGVK